jgi:hypothetical protein
MIKCPITSCSPQLLALTADTCSCFPGPHLWERFFLSLLRTAMRPGNSSHAFVFQLQSLYYEQNIFRELAKVR